MKANAFIFLFPFSNGKLWFMRMHVLLRTLTVGLVATIINRRHLQMCCDCSVSANALLLSLSFPRMHGVVDDAVVMLLAVTAFLWPIPN